MRIGGDPWPIVGVLPPGFQFPRLTDLWVPERTESTSRRGHSYFAVGRLRPSVTLEQARTELTTIAARLERQYPDTNTGRGVTAVRLHDELVGDVRSTLYLLWVRLFFVDGPRGFCQRHGKSYLTRRRRGGEGGGGGLLTGRAIPSAYRWAWCPAGTPVSWKSQYASRSRLAS